MTEMPELTRCPDCKGYYDTDDMTLGRCPNCAGPEPVDPWAGKFVPSDDLRIANDRLAANAALLRVADRESAKMERDRDQARRFAVAWQGEAEAYREVVEALTHKWVPFVSDGEGMIASLAPCCPLSPDHPVHRTVAVIQAELGGDDA